MYPFAAIRVLGSPFSIPSLLPCESPPSAWPTWLLSHDHSDEEVAYNSEGQLVGATLTALVPFGRRAVALARAGTPFSIETLMCAAALGAVAIGAAAEAAVVVLLFAAGELLESVQPFDVYEGEQVGEGNRSVAVRLVFRCERTLTDAEVDPVMDRLMGAVRAQGWSIREK